jgi:ATP-binding cassette subfamily A (ABC1) protein 3
MLPFFMLLVYILPIRRLVERLVAEKETKIRESMRMMGLNDFSYWTSWLVYYTIIVTLISLICLIILSINVIKNTNKFCLFLYLWLYGVS